MFLTTFRSSSSTCLINIFEQKPQPIPLKSKVKTELKDNLASVSSVKERKNCVIGEDDKDDEDQETISEILNRKKRDEEIDETLRAAKEAEEREKRKKKRMMH